MNKKRLIPNPYLHYEGAHIYNPLSDISVEIEQATADKLKRHRLSELADAEIDQCIDLGLLVPPDRAFGKEYRLKYVSIETHSVCNHSCYFCPVSVHERDRAFMQPPLFERITEEIATKFSGIEGVFLNGYNEPTIDPNFINFIKVLKNKSIAIAVNSNGSGLTPEVVDCLVDLGGLNYLCINLSTIDEHAFQTDRQASHLKPILRNLDYLGNTDIAQDLSIVVLGRDDDTHDQNHQAIIDRFKGSRFEIKRFTVNDRSGRVNHFQRKQQPIKRLRGCEQTGSRPLQHLHINAFGQCVLCCQDYYDEYVVGDLNSQSMAEVLEGPQMVQYRRWAYGIDEAPGDFICRQCEFALSEPT